MKRALKRILSLGEIGMLAALVSQSYAAGYKLEFQSASVLADAGEAAVVEDAGTNWYNAAGLVYLPHQVVASAIEIYAPSKFTGSAFAPSPFGPTFNFMGAGTAKSHTIATLPAYHYSMPFKDRFAIGFSFVPAWGFIEYYGGSSVTRYDLVRVYTKTIDLGPSIAVKITDCLSIGAGPDFHYFSASSKNHVRTQGPIPPASGTFGDSISRFSGERWKVGAHVGLLYRIKEGTRVGLSYRSKLSMRLRGHSDFVVADGGPSLESPRFQLTIPLPSTVYLSLYHEITPCWAMLGTIAWDQWGTLQRYHAKNIIQPATPALPSGINKDVFLPQKMHDTMDISVGTHYKLNENLMIRGSVKYLPTPTQSRFRDISFPDADKYGLQIGARYTMNKKMAFDVIYGHVFLSKVGIHNVNPITHSVINGHARSHIDFLGGQMVFNI